MRNEITVKFTESCSKEQHSNTVYVSNPTWYKSYTEQFDSINNKRRGEL